VKRHNCRLAAIALNDHAHRTVRRLHVIFLKDFIRNVIETGELLTEMALERKQTSNIHEAFGPQIKLGYGVDRLSKVLNNVRWQKI
jgi:hypothetical protein